MAGADGPGHKNMPAAGRSPAAGGWAVPTRRRSSQWSLRGDAKAASFNSPAHWAFASLLPPLAALGSRSSRVRLAFPARSGNRCRAVGRALTLGSGLPWRLRGGRRRLAGLGAHRAPSPAKPKHGRGPKAPAHALCALCAPAAPPGTLGFFKTLGRGRP